MIQRPTDRHDRRSRVARTDLDSRSCPGRAAKWRIIIRDAMSLVAVLGVCLLIVAACGQQAGSRAMRPGATSDGAVNESTAGIGPTLSPRSEPSDRLAAGGDAFRADSGAADWDAAPGTRETASTTELERLDLDADEEVWVLVRSGAKRARTRAPGAPPCGVLIARRVGSDDVGFALPLERTDVRARVDAGISRVALTQRFVNESHYPIDTTYVFPLPDDAAVDGFEMRIGARRIRGVIRERDQARALFEAARNAGHTASLLEQERPNVFAQEIANIEQGGAIDVELTYLHALPWRDGAFEWIFPFTIPVRFTPRDGSGAFERQALGWDEVLASADRWPTHVPARDVSIEVVVDRSMPIDRLSSPSHPISIDRTHDGDSVVRLSGRDVVPNADFVLKAHAALDRVASSITIDRDAGSADEGTFRMMIVPPDVIDDADRRPLDVVFVVDSSGSMKGAPIEQVRRAITSALDELRPGDRFQIVRFSDRAALLDGGMKPVDRRSIADASRLVRGIKAGGGTQMMRGVEAALDLTSSLDRESVIVFLTDGRVGNEGAVLGTIGRELGRTRIFSMGIGDAPNRFLLERMATVGRGAVTYVSTVADADDTMRRFLRTVGHPVLDDLRVDFGELDVREFAPRRARALFPGRPLVVSARWRGEWPRAVRVSGTRAGRVHELAIPVEARCVRDAPEIATLWARAKIMTLMNDWMAASGDRSRERIAADVRTLALEHDLVSQFTSFLAVDSSRPIDDWRDAPWSGDFERKTRVGRDGGAGESRGWTTVPDDTGW